MRPTIIETACLASGKSLALSGSATAATWSAKDLAAIKAHTKKDVAKTPIGPSGITSRMRKLKAAKLVSKKNKLKTPVALRIPDDQVDLFNLLSKRLIR